MSNGCNLACIVGARPNFMKMAPLLRVLSARDAVHTTLIHTGQHYDKNLSDIFFEQLDMRRPDISLEIGSGKHGEQTAKILQRMEEVLEAGPAQGSRYDRLVVVGDVNSTMAAALAAVKLGIPVAHVEAGLRSFDRTMPEEINRIVTDGISDMLLVSEPSGMDNLRREGHGDEKLHLVGNIMIDTLLHLLPQAKAIGTPEQLGLEVGEYAVVTLHRPANVDNADTLSELVDVLIDVSHRLPLVFPIHPRTEQRLERFGLLARLQQAPGVRVLPPQGYIEFLSLTSRARVMVTDSGGLQEESTVLGVPCLTMRENTERPVTVTSGTNTLVGNDAGLLRNLLNDVLDGSYKKGRSPELWDGHAAERIADILLQ